MSLALVIRLLSIFLGLENAAVIHGDLPSRLAGLHLPRETQVIVSYVRRESPFSFSAGTELETTLSPDVFYAQMDWGLARSGWKPVRLPIPTTESLLFKSNDLPPPETGLIGTPFFQKDGLTLTLASPTNRPGSPTRGYFEIERGNGPIQSLSFPEIAEPVRAIFPLLTAPKGAVMTERFGGSGLDSASGSAIITSNLSSNAIAEHFAAQLSAVGWHVTGKHSGEESASVTLEYSSSGQTYDAQLSVSRPQGRAYSDISLEAALRKNE